MVLPTPSKHAEGGHEVAFTADGKRVISIGSKEAQFWTLDARTVLWRAGSRCLTAAERSALLGESEDSGKVGKSLCEQTLAKCRESFDACARIVGENYDEQ